MEAGGIGVGGGGGSYQSDNFIGNIRSGVSDLFLPVKLHIALYLAKEHVVEVAQIIIQILKQNHG